MTKAVTAVTLAQPVRVPLKLEQGSHLRRGEQSQGALPASVEMCGLAGQGGRVQVTQQGCPVGQAAVPVQRGNWKLRAFGSPST